MSESESFKTDPDEDDLGDRSTEIGNCLEEPDISCTTARKTHERGDGRHGIHAEGTDDRHQAERERTPHIPVDPRIDDKEGNDQADND
jgi:hypothetical protein